MQNEIYFQIENMDPFFHYKKLCTSHTNWNIINFDHQFCFLDCLLLHPNESSILKT